MKIDCNQSLKRSLTLIELLVVVALIAMLAGSVGWQLKRYFYKSQEIMDRKRFEKVLKMGRSYALITEADWELALRNEEGSTTLVWSCPEDREAKSIFPSFSFSGSAKWFMEDGKKECSKITFFSNGLVAPLGKIQLAIGEERADISLNELFNFFENRAPSIEEILEKG